MRLIDADKIPEVSWDKIEEREFRRTIAEQPTVDAIPVQYILTTIREWNRFGYTKNAEGLEILVMNWDKENMEQVERKE